eukprot:TRINITY_DN4419_c1_g1_i1.p1 TRINITY_DN4419_c1_g1~~TRINITY_DN4419_c1_g1_i1.p1  ORF type:complete len:1066 (+),score=195.19 TRINITY_DN4419_c1_g1_i1:1086-4283(+)
MATLEHMAAYADELIGVLIKAAAEDPDPLIAIMQALEGARPLGDDISSDRLRTVLFRCFNAYDDENCRTLGMVQFARFVTDFVDCLSGTLVDLGPKVATTPDESWQDRSRWDVAGQELSLKAKRLHNGFKSDPSHWTARWYDFMDTTKDGRGLRYAEVQNAFAGPLTSEWLSELNGCALLADNPASPVPMSYRNGSTSPFSAPPFSHPNNSFSGPAPGHAPNPTEMTLDITDAANSIHQEEKKRIGFMLCLYYSCHFVLLSCLLTLQVDPSRTYPLHTMVAGAFVNVEYEPGRDLHSVRTVDDVYAWLQGAWAPALFRDLPPRGVYGLNPLGATPYLRQKRRAAKDCTDLDYFTRGSSCYDSGSFSSDAFNGFNAVYVKQPFHKPIADEGSDFVVEFPVFNSSDSGYLQTFSDAVDLVASLKADGWFTMRSAFLEANSLIYNPSLDALSLQRVVFVISDSGTVTPLATRDNQFSDHHHGSLLLTRKAVVYDSDENRSGIRLGFEIVLLAVTFSEMIVEAVRYFRTWTRSRCLLGYFYASPWNLYQIAFYMFAVTYTGLYITHALEKTHNNVLTLDNKDTGVGVYREMVLFGGLLIILSIIRVFRFISAVSPYVRVVSRVLHAVVVPLVVFGVLYTMAGLVFAIAGHYLFGSGLDSFATLGSAIQTVLQSVIVGLSYDQISSPLANPTASSFPLVYYWVVVVCLSVLLAGLLAAIFVASYEAVMERSAKERKENQDIPSTGRPWSRRSLTFQCSNYPSMLLRYWREREWVIPVARRHPLQATVAAEVIGGTNLRVSLSLKDSDAQPFSGFLLLLPRDLLRNTGLYNRSGMATRYAAVTRCKAGMEPKYYNRPNWCQYAQEWWMSDEYIHDFANGGMIWSGVEEGVTSVQATRVEVHRRRVWFENTLQGVSIQPCDETLYTSTQYVPFKVGIFRPRVLQVHTSCRTLMPVSKWERQSLIFEFQDVVSPSWPNKDFASLPVRGVYPTYSAVNNGVSDLSAKLVVVLGDQPVPAYICGHHGRFTSEAVTEAFGEGVATYIEDMVIGRFGISSERPMHNAAKSSSPLHLD